MVDGIEIYGIPNGCTHLDALASVECDEWQYVPGSPEVIDSKFQGRIVAGVFMIRRGPLWSWGNFWEEGETDRRITVFWCDARKTSLAAVAWQDILEQQNARGLQVSREMLSEDPGNIYIQRKLREREEMQRELAARRTEWN